MLRKLLKNTWWLILLLLLGTAAYLGWQIPSLRVEANAESLMDEDDPALEVYTESRLNWGSDEFAILCVTADDWFTPEGGNRLKAIRADLEAVPYYGGMLSVFDVPLLRQEPDKQLNFFTIAASITHIGEKDLDYAAAKAELLDHAIARGNVVSADGRSLSFLVDLDVSPRPEPVEARRREFVDGLRKVAANWSPKLAEPARLTGVPVVNINLLEHVAHDLKLFGIAAAAFFTLAFAAIYRRPRFVVVPLLACALPVALVLGYMVVTGRSISVITSNLPVLLFVLMLPYTVYFIERYYERRAQFPDESGSDASLASLRSIALPCLFSCTTSMAGFAALTTSGIVPVKTFGGMMTAGMAVGFAAVFVFLAASMHPLKGMAVARSAAGADAGPRGLVRLFAKATLASPKGIAILSCLVLVVAILGALRLNAETKFTSYFWPDSEVYRGVEFIDKKMGGSTALDVILTSETPNAFLKPDGLAAVEAVEAYFKTVAETGNIRSVARVRDELKKSLPAMDDTAILGLAKIAIAPVLRDVVTADGKETRIFVRLQETAPALNRNKVLSGLREHLKREPALEGFNWEVTGIFQLYANMIRSLIESQKQTLLIVVGAIFAMLLILFRSPSLAFVVLLPQVLPATVMLGVMGWSGIPLDLVTVMIAAIAMGVGVDSAIQYTMRYREELAAGADPADAVLRAHATTGRAIWIATSIIIAGFCVLLLSDFVPTVWFGLFTAISMLISQFAALTTLPSLLLWTGAGRPGQRR